ncbi:MAG TPA: recombinase family protein [Candidatus Saccharimonadia bacterium]|nr:recombinase family protein [Candidatus Saccharimonadia bacterium]
MPGHPRITIRLTPALEALVSARVRQGSHVSDIVREALEAYLGACPTACPTQSAAASASAVTASAFQMDHMSAAVSANLADVSARLSASVSDVLDMRERLAQLEQRVEDLSARGRPRLTPRPTPPPQRTDYDAAAAVARMQALQAEGLSLAQIAAQLTAEGIPTRHGQPWHKGTVGYLLQAHRR